MMRRILLFCIASFLLMVGASVSAQETTTPASNNPQITLFSTTASAVSRDDLANRTARVPLAWETSNRPLTSNLVFEQVLPGGATVNVELPRLLPWVVSNGRGLAAPILPGGDASEIVLRVRLINLFNNNVLSEQQLTLPIVNGGSSGSVGDRASITSFTTIATFINEDRLENGSARIPVSWATANRPTTANLVFEQVLSDGTLVNIELPRENPFVPSSGNGLAAPVAPGGDATSITLRVSLFDLINGRVYDLRELTVPVLAAGATPTVTPAPAADIRSFVLDSANLNSTELAQGSARVVVRWSVVNRPPNSNLVFEQVLNDGTVVNVELPRTNPIVASEGQGLIAPRAPGGNATTARFVLSLIDLADNRVYDRAEVTVPIVVVPTPSPSPTASPTPIGQGYNITFTTPISGIGRQEIAAGGRIQVSWNVSPRPADSNLYFEQVMPDGSTFNIELPRDNPFVPSSGVGAVAPILPPGFNINQIVVRLRLSSFSHELLAQRELIIPLSGESNITPAPRRFYVFTPSNMVIESSQITGGSVIIPISWDVDQRPNNSNLVFSQVFPNGTLLNAELPRPDQIVPSSGTGAVQLRDPGPEATEVRVRVQLVELRGSRVYDQRELVIPIAGRGNVTPAATTAGAQQAGENTACAIAWFTAAAQGCPTGAPEQVVITVQQFERGVMLLRADTNQVLFLTNEGAVIVGQAGSSGGVPEPPEGLYAPSALFGNMWGTNQERAGWATTPEGSYLATLQTSIIEASADVLYMTLPDGRVARLTPATNSATWQAVG